ncbi:oxidative stress defense protein [Holospora obtusa F1]|uniref:Oxidative stress defense protein n=1 Tax=Holospora obtusa F1 TaxID=1399147 RepID=W6TF62_HOLOB|nr:SIMPL domain-containing protein [Holospora obtusa]ETZ07619.1 oxidative stress defense protein [Holospora obtusa F1]
MKKNIFIKVILLGCCISGGISVYCLSKLDWETEHSTLTVEGFSEREVKSDLASWEVEVELLCEDSKSGIAQLNSFKEKFFDFCKNQGIRGIDVNHFNIEITPFSYEEYVINNQKCYVKLSIHIDSKDVDKIQNAKLKLAEHMPSFSVVSRLSFFYTKSEKLREQMLQESFEDAKKVAECIAKSASLHLIKVKSVTESDLIISNSTKPEKSDIEKKGFIKNIFVCSTVSFLFR